MPGWLENTKKVNWIPPADPRGSPAHIFSVCLASPDIPADSDWWPGLTAHKSEVLTRAPLANGETVWLISRVEHLPEDFLPRIEERRFQVGQQLASLARQYGADAGVGRTLISMLPGEESGPRSFIEVALHAFRNEEMGRAYFQDHGGDQWANAFSNEGELP
jgi:hypothetical protein